MLSKRNLRAYSLVELLTVMAIMAIMASVSIPSLSGLMQSQGITSNVSTLTDLIEQSRQAAMAQNTFVWLGISYISGKNELAVVALAGNSGQCSDLSNNNYRPLMKPEILTNVNLDGTTYLNLLPTANKANNTDFLEQVASLTSPSNITFQQTLPGGSTATTFTAIEFKPDGELYLGPGAPVNLYLGLGLSGGPATAAKHSSAGIQVSMLSGQVSIFRP